MFSIDFPEIVIIFGVALVVLGPKKLPGAAAQIGRWVGRARAMARQFREQLEQEVGSVESALDLNKAMESSTTESTAASATSETARPPPAPQEAAMEQHGGAAEYASAADHPAAEHTAAEQADLEPAERQTDLFAGEVQASDSDEAAIDEPRMEHWPESAGGWSPDSLIAASMPHSGLDSGESSAPRSVAGEESEPLHESVHICASAGGARGAPGVRASASGEHSTESEPAAVEHGGR